MILKEKLSVFFAVMFHEFWERNLILVSFFPRYFAFVILVVVVFFLLHFSFFLALSNYILYMFQWCHIDSECRFISNNLNRIHSHLKWPIMSNDSECATSQISGLSDPFGARSMWFARPCHVAWNAAVKPSLSWGSFTTASPRLKWWISWGKSGRTSMKERVKSWGKGGEKHAKP